MINSYGGSSEMDAIFFLSRAATHLFSRVSVLAVVVLVFDLIGGGGLWFEYFEFSPSHLPHYGD